MVLRCTVKLLNLLAVSPRSLAEVEPSSEDWYANLLYLDRRKCLLVTHAATLFSLLEADVHKRDLQPIGAVLVRLIERELRAEGLPSNALGRLDPADVRLARTADRQVLGCMNDNAFSCRMAVAQAGSLTQTDIPALNRQLRMNIHSSREYVPAIELIRQAAVPLG